MMGGKSFKALTEEEFTTMMLEFDVAGQWMLEQLKLKRANAGTTVPPLPQGTHQQPELALSWVSATIIDRPVVSMVITECASRNNGGSRA
ncbi:hypothetical protein [Pseudomonas hunanensis]|uniref:hypothetical protein n=1 Tax=Pseudomonas hunanensis TaxID=1247546 RepID=UPI00381884C4